MYLAKLLSKDISFSVIVVLIITSLIADMLIAKLYIYTTNQAFSGWRIPALLIIGAVYVIGQYLVLEIVKKRIKEIKSRKRLGFKKIHAIVTICQYAIAAIIIFLIFQVIFASKYHTTEIIICVTISYVLSITLLIVLALRFLSWFKVNKNIVILLYFISSLIISANGAFTLIFVDTILIQQPAIVRPHSGPVYPTQFLASVSLFSIVNYGFIISSIAAFLSFWFATSFLLRHYSEKLGAAKYWVLLGIPLLYFVLQFLPSFVNLFSSILKLNPVLFSIIYTVTFTLSKPLGGILFGIAFWVVARNLPTKSMVKRYFIMASFGIILLFKSNQAVIFASNNYPAFGLVTVSVMGLSSYLLFLGIYASAISVAQDEKLRHSIRRSIEENSDLLGNIGEAQFEDQLQKTVIKKTRDLSEKIIEETGIASSLDERDIHDYVILAINEAKRARSPSNN